MAYRLLLRLIEAEPGLRAFHANLKTEEQAFSCQIYASDQQFDVFQAALRRLQSDTSAGHAILSLGDMEQAFAGGGLQIDCTYDTSGHPFVQIRMVTGAFAFKGKRVADQISIHLESEPELIDDFANDIQTIARGAGDTAVLMLRPIELPWPLPPA